MSEKTKKLNNNEEEQTENNGGVMPTNDYVFKRIFGKKGNEDLTKDFLEAVTGDKYKEIKLDDTPILEAEVTKGKMGTLNVKVSADKKGKAKKE